MGFLAKTPQMRNSKAALVVFLSGYVAALVAAYNFFDAPVVAIWLVICVSLIAILFMSFVFLVSSLVKRTDIVDIAWGLVFIVIACACWLLNDYDVNIGWNVQTITLILVIIWGLRLAITLFIRVKSRPEDKRYVELRKKWKGSAALNTYVRIFVTQALLAVVISAAVIIALTSPVQEPGIYTYIGAGVWLIGFMFEIVGDWQLKRFVSDSKNKGKVLNTGLWRYTRHPNYFGEATMWWGIFIIALSTYIGWLGIISPVIITFLLLFVSGVPMAEVALSKRKAWKSYKAQTSKFVPLPSRK